MTNDTPERLTQMVHEAMTDALRDYDIADEVWRNDPEFGQAVRVTSDAIWEFATRQRDEAVGAAQDGSRPIPIDREQLGRFVREAWVRWAKTQPNPKPSWLVDYDELSEPDKEADRQIGEAVARWTIIHDAARFALTPSDATTALAARDARRDAETWNAAIEVAAKYHDEIFEHDSGGIQYSNAVGIPISNRAELEESCKRAHIDAKAIRALKKETPNAD